MVDLLLYVDDDDYEYDESHENVIDVVQYLDDE